MHFEDLWNQCEKFHQEEGNSSVRSVSSLIDELIVKLNLYKALVTRGEESSEAKTMLLGEVLFSLTQLSLQEKLNVFKALLQALNNRKV